MIVPRILNKNELPNLPAEVWEVFVAPLNTLEITERDIIPWPDTNKTDRWRYYFGETVEEFSKRTWEKESKVITRDSLHKETIGELNQLIKTAESGAHTANVIRQKVDYIRANNKIESPLTITESSDGVKILDGLHRYAALIESNFSDEIEVWIATV